MGVAACHAASLTSPLMRTAFGVSAMGTASARDDSATASSAADSM